MDNTEKLNNNEEEEECTRNDYRVYVLDDGETYSSDVLEFKCSYSEIDAITQFGVKPRSLPHFWKRARWVSDLMSERYISDDKPSLSLAVNMASELEKDDFKQLMLILPDLFDETYGSMGGEI